MDNAKEIFSELKTICTLKNKKLGGGIIQCNMPYITTCRADAPCKKEIKEFLIENIAPLLLAGLGVLIMLALGKV